MVAPFFDYNPRNLKQYINALKLRIYITYYSIGVLFEERNSLTVEQLGKFTAITVKYPRLLPRLEEDKELLDKLETYARKVPDSFPDNLPNFHFLNSESTTCDREIKIAKDAKDWVDNNPKLKELLYDDKVSLAENEGIKKLLEVSSELELHPRYFKLRQLLEAEKWNEADEETLNVMLQVANIQRRHFLDVESMQKFPCKDLRKIDRLWFKSSGGKFGFSVQKKIYESLGGTKEYNKEVWEEFSDRVGWRRRDEIIKYSNLIFRLEEAPPAHLPVKYIELEFKIWNWWTVLPWLLPIPMGMTRRGMDGILYRESKRLIRERGLGVFLMTRKDL